MLLLAMLAFAQAQVAFAACQMDRGAMAQAMAADDPCTDCGTPIKAEAHEVMTSACLTHCTSDLQVTSARVAEPVLLTSAPVLVLPHLPPPQAFPPDINASPPRTVPARVLLHSYLI